CGLSDQPADWSYRLADHVDNLERLVLELDLQRITLVVHDWGGAIGMGFAARHPERIARLVITNSAAFTGGALPWRIALCRLPLVGRVLVEGLNGFARAATVMAVERPLREEVKRAWLAPHAAPRSARATLRFVEDIPTHPRHPSWSTLTQIAAGLPLFHELPCLLLWGMRDWCFTPDILAEWERRLPRAESHTIAGAGHYLFEDAPQETLEAVRTFLDRSPLPTSAP
ncbi:MAG: alpha/beta fold hydrolase, partial [Planctomycetota bacterium]